MSAATQIARRFDSLFVRNYVRSKLSTDPMYPALLRHLRDDRGTIIDIGCGVGVTAFWLREHGFSGRIVAVDHDPSKIVTARAASGGDTSLVFRTADAREPIDDRGTVLILDVLQYFSDAGQMRILENAIAATRPGGAVIIREGIRERSWRYVASVASDLVAWKVRWMKADRLNFPRRERLLSAFPGFSVEVEPAWGATPFNNYLFVFRRSGDGITKE